MHNKNEVHGRESQDSLCKMVDLFTITYLQHKKTVSYLTSSKKYLRLPKLKLVLILQDTHKTHSEVNNNNNENNYNNKIMKHIKQQKRSLKKPLFRTITLLTINNCFHPISTFIIVSRITRIVSRGFLRFTRFDLIIIL